MREGAVHVTLAFQLFPLTSYQAVVPVSWRSEAGSTAVLDHTLRSHHRGSKYVFIFFRFPSRRPHPNPRSASGLGFSKTSF
ncbi:hypothetical protein EDB92DRAFT_871505 [Lactarius akahatsu]|uniref:Uncharacterized protein n=1 Tax=Lactarius akahatsu TaxID=416441 RepID=A0AAD4LJC5_9AGAM|nr:hypothetical protein EDB92DRAFT_871505 [Lactarius akahatsu]